MMKTPESILETARERARTQGLPYAGALLPEEAHALLLQHPGAKLVDVRTRAEWEWVGRVPLPNTAFIEWNTWPSGQPNPDFLSSLKSQVNATDVPVLFLCRSGARSHNAAATATTAGYTQAINVLQGFEGDRDQNGRRNSVGGWRAAGLPWIQG
jgi:rhodanese-related sulfurtransferase